jgi:hypothetical protein
LQRLYLEYMGDSIELPRGETLVGRDVGCALRFNDPSISRRHLKFVRRASETFVEDLGSSNGTLVNGCAVGAPMRVTDGDVITLGVRTLTVRAYNDNEQAAATMIIDPDPFAHDTVLEGLQSDTAHVPGISTRMTLRVPRVTAPPSGVASDIDRRRHERITMELPLVYISDELEVEATTSDLSHSGVFVKTQILEPVGTPCKLTILIDGGPPLHLKGVVRRVVGNNDRGEAIGLGIELSDLGEHQKRWIDIATSRC